MCKSEIFAETINLVAQETALAMVEVCLPSLTVMSVVNT